MGKDYSRSGRRSSSLGDRGLAASMHGVGTEGPDMTGWRHDAEAGRRNDLSGGVQEPL